MTKVLYSGDISPCRIKIGTSIVNGWNKGEIKDLDSKQAKKLVNDNKNFSLTDKTKKLEEKEEKVVKQKKEESPDFDNMDKDDLLDFSAINGIETDYSMTVKEIKEKILKKIN